MNLEIKHTTTYQYDQSVHLYPHLLYLRPRETPLLSVVTFALDIKPSAKLYWMRDDFDNLPASIHFSGESRTLEIQSICRVATADIPPFDFLVRDYAQSFPFDYEPLHRSNLGIYLEPPIPAEQDKLRDWLQPLLRTAPSETVSWLFALNQWLYQNLQYKHRDEQGIQAPLETIAKNSGSCRDYASLLIACARTQGLAARFVSGYLYDPNSPANSPGDMHAWAEVFLPGAGWRGLDPTNGLFCNNAYIPVAHAVVAESVNPIQGSFFSATPAVAKLSSKVRIDLNDTTTET
jgi:transglutaminase-like putative cysteine protease